MTIGEKNVTKLNKTILLVGETGAGKSTLINALVNYAIGVKWEDEVCFKIIEEEKESQSESQTEGPTSDVMVYQIFGFEGQTLPFSLTIIDTPGYGDTRGIENDIIISERLLDLFRSEDGVHEINAVGLVMKQSDNRLSDRLRYIFDSTVSLFSKNMEKNIVALITHSNGMTPKNVLKALEDAKIKCARDAKNQPVHFLFDNCQTEDRTEDQEELKHSHKITVDQMSRFNEFLETAEPRTLVTTVTVLNNRVRLAACIRNLQERIESIELKQRQIKQTQEALKKHEQEMDRDINFTVEVDEPYKEKESIAGGYWGLGFFEGAVTCNVCEENCHYPGCSTSWSAKHCEVMKGGHCTSCIGKCPVTDHVKEKWIYVTKTRKVKKTLHDIKARYDENKAERENKQNLLENLQKKMGELQRGTDQLLDEAFQHVQTLEQIALNVNSVSTYVHLDFLIEKMKERRDTEKVQKLEEMKHRVETDEGFREAAQYMRDKLAAAGGAVKGDRKSVV